jgi:hypothetical protein
VDEKESDGKIAGMIQETVIYSCRVCGSTNIVKNGTNRLKQQQYYSRLTYFVTTTPKLYIQYSYLVIET